jgi:hypothetical protein
LGFLFVGPRRWDRFLLGVEKSLEQVFATDDELTRPVAEIAAS